MLDVVADRAAALGADPVSEIPHHFGPIRLEPLAATPRISNQECHCDGYYDADTFDIPTIFYRPDVSPRRIRYTLLHELGHHLIRTVEPTLLELIDDATPAPADHRDSILAAPTYRSADYIEERACEQFGAQLIINDNLLVDTVGGQRVTPDVVANLYNRSGASWSATAIRLAGTMEGHSAIVIVRRAGTIDFAASTPAIRRWAPASPVAPSGPLAHALQHGATEARDIYRYGRPDAEQLWCDIRQQWDGLSVAVLSDEIRPGKLNVFEDQAEDWTSLHCTRCGELRGGEWCYECRGPRCTECEACGCWRPPHERRCEGPCGLRKGVGTFAPDSDICNDCLD